MNVYVTLQLATIVRAIANYGIYHDHYNSFLGHNALLCFHEINF